MKRVQKALSVIIVVFMVLAMLPVMVIPAFGMEGTGVTFYLDAAPNDAHKLVFQAKTPDRIQILDIVFSYDNTLIKPVRRTDQARCYHHG
ncbi:MAG: hypothetical protein FWH49_08500 [Clostridiales bacterium]|nr:hypothetical protein [Clostridiales bacterium]